MPNTEFESKLHSLVYPKIESIAPKLVDDMVAFELLNVNDDETVAQAVYAFRLGDTLAYIPVFYDNGRVKGTKLLYLEDEDLFVPMDDDWVDHVQSRQPYELGRMPENDEKVQQASPVFEALRDNFDVTTKNSSGLAKAARIPFGEPKYVAAVEALDLSRVLVKMGEAAARQVVQTIKSDDGFGRAFLRFYPMEKLAETGLMIQDKLEKQRKPSNEPINDGGIVDKTKKKPVVLTSDAKELQGLGLSKKDTLELKRFGVVVRDRRDKDDVTKIKRTTTPQTWTSPSEPGVYRVIAADGDIREAVVTSNLITVGEGRARAMMVIDETGSGGQIAPGSLVATEDLGAEAWTRKFNKLPKVIGSRLTTDDKFVLINSDMVCTPMLTFIGRSRDRDGVTTLYVKQETYVQSSSSDDYGCCGPTPCCGSPLVFEDRAEIHVTANNSPTPFIARYAREDTDRKPEWPHDYEYGYTIMVLPEADNDRMAIAGSSLTIGRDVRVLKVPNEDDCKYMSPDMQSLWPIIKSSSAGKAYKKLTVHGDLGEYDISCGYVKSGRVNRIGAIRHLICVHGADKQAALQALRDVDAADSTNQLNPMVFALKYAAGFPDIDTSTSGYDSFGTPAEQTASIDQSVEVDDAQGNEPFLTQDIERATRAAQTGDKSVFDTAVLLSLIRRHDVGGAVEEMLGDLTLGMDRIGRLIFLTHAHKEEMGDRYGRDDVPQLLDSLESLFAELGETLLFLKKRTGEDQEPSETFQLV